MRTNYGTGNKAPFLHQILKSLIPRKLFPNLHGRIRSLVYLLCMGSSVLLPK